MKKLLTLTLAIFMVLSMTACTELDAEMDKLTNAVTEAFDASTPSLTPDPQTTTAAPTEPQTTDGENNDIGVAVETTPAAGKPTQGQPNETTNSSTTPTQTQPQATKPAETKPAETKPQNTKPAATEPKPTQPPATTPAPTKPTHTHSYTKKVVAATCEAGGYTTNTCSCGDSYTSDKTSALGHSYTKGNTVAPTCTAKGYTEYTCSTCKKNCTDNTTSALGHDFSNLIEDVAATTEKEGKKVY